MVLLGAAVATGEIGLSQDDVLAAIRKVVPARFLELNEKAFAAGTRVGGNEGK